ncbi:MAG: maleylacetoacetate isomerase [Pseudomonadota bacterium]
MGDPVLQLYTYHRSSAAYRVRIALHLKGIEYQPRFVHLVRGEQHHPEHRALNPQGFVPVLVDGERVLTQSLAIMEYLEERHPQPPLLPADPWGRARVRALAQAIACDIHPLNNRRVLVYLEASLGLGEEARRRWVCHWIAEGLSALEALLSKDAATGPYCHGDRPTLADACLVPQLYNARRFGCDLAPYPTLQAIAGRCEVLPAFQAAAPERQPDASPGKSPTPERGER